jgi:hypothetical protein
MEMIKNSLSRSIVSCLFSFWHVGFIASQKLVGVETMTIFSKFQIRMEMINKIDFHGRLVLACPYSGMMLESSTGSQISNLRQLLPTDSFVRHISKVLSLVSYV